LALAGFAAAFLIGCASGVSEPEGSEASVASSSSAVGGGCTADPTYPCTLAEVDPAVLALESEYAAQVIQRLDENSRDEALEWVASQAGVVESFADETVFVFRLEGGLPFVVIDVPAQSEPGAPRTSQPSTVESGQISYTVHDALSDSLLPAGVVGEGTAREDPQNRKRALFIEPWSTHGSMFDQPDADPIGRLRALRDYNHDPSDVQRIVDERVTPRTFLGWGSYDLIFVSTHGGQWPGGSTLATGVRQRWDVGTDTFRGLCLPLGEPYSDLPGVTCTVIRQKVKDANGQEFTEQYVTVSVFHKFFEEQYGKGGGLERAVIYVGGCFSLANDSLASAIAGSTSAYLGWTAAVDWDREIPASALLLQLLAREGGGRTVGAAYETLEKLGHTGDARFGAALEIYDNGDEPRNLRIYDLGVLHDPRVPTDGPGLRDGDELQVIGTPGDGIDDRIELVLDIIGLIDPQDTSTDGLPGAVPRVSLGSTASDASDAYALVLFRDGERVLGYDSDGNPVTGVPGIPGEGISRYLYTEVDLKMDVERLGAEAEVTLGFAIHLAEGGISDYEVDVRLVPPEPGATVTIGSRTYEFELTNIFGASCQLSEDQSRLIAGGLVDGDEDKARFAAHIEPDGHDVENLFSVHFVTVFDPATGESWAADELEFPMDMALAALPPGSSQIDSVTVENGTARGTATFIDTAAVNEAWLNNTAYPTPVQGTFAIRCS